MKRNVALAAILAAALLAGGLLLVQEGGETAYQYQVKSEQVSDANRLDSNELVELEELSPHHQEAIFAAFKKSDHFLGGASAFINTDECLNLTQEEKWQVVEVEGVPLLVGIGGPETYQQMTPLYIIGIVLLVLGPTVWLIALMIRVD